MSEKPRKRAKAHDGAASNKQPASQVVAGQAKPAPNATPAPDPTNTSTTGAPTKKKKKTYARAQ